MTVHPPCVVQFVSLFRKRFHQAHILIKPIASLVVRAICVESAVVVSSVLKEYANRFLFALEDDVGIGMAASDVRETSDNAENLSEIIRTFPRYGKCRNRAGTGSADAMLLRSF